jgi:hypothetical protein
MDVTDGNGPPRESDAVLRCAESQQRGTPVAAKRPTRARSGERAAKRGTTREVQATPSAVPERRFVDVDPWAMLLEGLMEMPEEDAPAERQGGNRE